MFKSLLHKVNYRGVHTGRGLGKLTSIKDAVSLVRDNDTLLMSGFVCQAIPEALMKALGERYLEEGHPKDLTFMFYGAGDPAGTRGTNRLKHPGMIKRVISSHYGQSPDLHAAILNNEIEAYSLPMGAISRMVRCQASGSPGHITRIGLGTFVDPRNGGGKLNEKTTTDLVDVVTLDGMEYLRYKPIQINHAFIRATTSDPSGNLSIERESVQADIRVIATAARSSGGLVTAQVSRMASNGSLRMRDVAVPGAIVDCVVVADEEDHPMSFYTKYNPSWSGEIKIPTEGIPTMEMSARKIIARRAAMELKSSHIVNLGIGMPEGIASVAAEEGVLQEIILTTEAGTHGGMGVSGHDFGPAVNPTAMVDITQQFDFYNGGGLSICFLGAGQCDVDGNVNVSQLSKDRLIGPGGFIDITQSTPRVIFMGTFMKKGLKVNSKNGKLEIVNEGKVPMFEDSVMQVSFNSKQAILNGQKVKYITERAVFELCPKGLVLSEVAPGIDVQKEILDLMRFKPIILQDSLDEIPRMDEKIFCEHKMDLQKDFQFTHERYHFDKHRNTAFIDFSDLVINTASELEQIFDSVEAYFEKITNGGVNKIHVVANYANICLPEDTHVMRMVKEFFARMQAKYYLSVKRLGGKAFKMQKYFKDVTVLSNVQLWDMYRGDASSVNRNRFREKTREIYQVKVTDRDIATVFGDVDVISSYDQFEYVLDRFLDYFELEHFKDEL